MSHSALASYGILIKNLEAQPTTAERAVIVLGVQRGGTSMVAEMLSTLGVYMGEMRPPTYEDKAFSLHLRNYTQEISKKAIPAAATIEALTTLARERDATHKIWGFKFPDVICPELYSTLRNPMFISVHRDPISICARLKKSAGVDIEHTLPNIMALQKQQNNFLLTTPYPFLALSYEKALLNPQACVQHVIDFLGLEVTQSQLEQAIKNIEPSPKAYVEATHRMRKGIIGYLDFTREGMARGWVADTNALQRNFTVHVLVDGVRCAKGKTDQKRPDVQAHLAAQHGTVTHENFGFLIPLPQRVRDGKKHIVNVEIEGADSYDIRGSGMEYTIT